MKHRLTMWVVMAALAMGGVAACGGNPEPEGPTPEELEQARLDSIARARAAEEEARLRAAEEERRRAEEERARIEAETAAAREIITTRIHFDYDRSELREDAESLLMNKVPVLRANPDVQIRIAGHADERGSVEYNLALGQRRAEAAKDFLVRYGISPTRITTVSFGEDRPLVNESNEEAWAMNRRDEFTIVAGGETMRNPGE